MAWSRRRVAIWACILGTATLTVGTGVATGAKLKTKSNSITIGTEEQGSVAAKCKKGTKAISGGFAGEIVDFFGFFVPITPFESMKISGRKWESAADNFAEPGSLTSFAYCRDAKVKRRTAETTVPGGNSVGSVTATCPQGTKAVSGGFDNPDFANGGLGAPAILPFESRMTSKREWTVSAANLGDDPGTLVAQVVCREGKVLTTAQESEFADHADVYGVEASCSPGKRVISGGFDSTLPHQGDADGPTVYRSLKQGKRSWEVSFYDFEAEALFTTYAYCENKKAK
jgi:hypothetical protein